MEENVHIQAGDKVSLSCPVTEYKKRCKGNFNKVLSEDESNFPTLQSDYEVEKKFMTDEDVKNVTVTIMNMTGQDEICDGCQFTIENARDLIYENCLSFKELYEHVPDVSRSSFLAGLVESRLVQPAPTVTLTGLLENLCRSLSTSTNNMINSNCIITSSAWMSGPIEKRVKDIASPLAEASTEVMFALSGSSQTSDDGWSLTDPAVTIPAGAIAAITAGVFSLFLVAGVCISLCGKALWKRKNSLAQEATDNGPHV
ncbi:uncharacterized protein LOC118557711 isoform X2 [Fundulus heteroclitus]|uniref:uncharacterized protein LOC118557711 isoform X2 n=1 Tax=Fundulus heteroclitus TaxID=8078 RepID=UPI00165BC028|nr:uncharacterized protein LOC118557711 isoform X2 [Fundulus heteroclitus]